MIRWKVKIEGLPVFFMEGSSAARSKNAIEKNLEKSRNVTRCDESYRTGF